MSTLRRGGFSLLELMLVLAMMATLLGIGAVAVKYVRESAVRIQCANNLKQLVLAAHNRADTDGFLPSNPDTVSDRHGTLQDLLQPFLE